MAEVETGADKKEEALEELKRHVKDLHEEDDSAKRREAATTMRMLAKENFGLKVLFVYEDESESETPPLRIRNQPHPSHHVLSVVKSNLFDGITVIGLFCFNHF